VMEAVFLGEDSFVSNLFRRASTLVDHRIRHRPPVMFAWTTVCDVEVALEGLCMTRMMEGMTRSASLAEHDRIWLHMIVKRAGSDPPKSFFFPRGRA
jgi:hypothetical protein